MEPSLNQVSSMPLFHKTSGWSVLNTKVRGILLVVIVSKCRRKQCMDKRAIIQPNSHQESLLSSQKVPIHLDKIILKVAAKEKQ